MEFFLFGLALIAFWAEPSAAALLLRCALFACGRFSPRAALALSGIASLGVCAGGLAWRSSLRISPRMALTAVTAFAGGALGRAALLMLTARFPGSLTLARVQGAPLLALTLLTFIPGGRLPEPRSRVGYALLCALLAAVDGFLGAGSMTLTALLRADGVHRDALPADTLVLTLCAQAGALLLTGLCGAAQTFPARMLVLTAAGAALGACMQKQRSALPSGTRTALRGYLALSALSCLEQAV